MPELNGFETLIRLRERAKTIPVVFLTGHGDVSAVIRAMRLGVVDFFEKPVNSGVLLECIQHWVQYDIKTHEALHRRQGTLERLAKLSKRQRQVLDLRAQGHVEQRNGASSGSQSEGDRDLTCACHAEDGGTQCGGSHSRGRWLPSAGGSD